MSLKNTDVRTPGAQSIAKKWNLPLTKVYALISQGAKVEFEHNRDKEKAKQVARDHINERPDYYKRLKHMERLPIRMRESSFNEGLSTEPERDSETIGDYTGSSRKVMKVDEITISPKIKERVKKAATVGMTAANIAAGANAFDHASRGVGSPVRDVTAVASGVPGKIGWSVTPGHYALKGLEHIKSKQQAKKMEEQGSPANPARYTERPMYENDAMKNAEDKIKAAFTKDKVKDMFNRVDKQRDKDSKWVAYKKRKESQLKEMAPLAGRSSTNIIDRRPGLSMQGIRNAADSFRQNMQLRTTPTYEPEKYGKDASRHKGPDGATSVQSKTSAAISAAADTVRGIGNRYRDTLGLDMDRPGTGIAKDIAKTVAPVTTAAATAAYDRLKPSSPNINPSSLPASKASPTSIPTVGGATPPNLGSDTTPKDIGNLLDNPDSRTPSKSPGPVTPASSGKDITDMIDTMDKQKQSKTPSQMNEISAELVGKVSNARFWRGEAPSKTLTRAINKKFIESGKPVPKKKDTKTVKEETTMDTKELINEALDDILENNLVSMKENFLTALQEKAMERLEEKKKEIAANYFAQ